MRFPWNFKYASVSGSDISHDGDEKVGFLEGGVPSIRQHAKAAGKGGLFLIYGTIFNLAILALSLTLFSASHWRDSGRNALLKKTSFFSPILERIDIATSVKRTNGTLFPGPDPSIARQMPNPEADKRWDELELTRTIVISREEIRKLGKDPEEVAKFENDFWGLGDDAYMAQVDVFHQLHCLNILRKLVYSDYYNWTSANLHHPELWYIHNNHCVDILYQALTCNANLDLYTMRWMETQSHPFPDFSINHKCIDFDRLIDWRKQNSVDIDLWINQTKPEGVKQVPAPDMYYEIFGHQQEDEKVPG